MRYIKVHFKLISWNNDNGNGSCYVYTSNPGFTATASNGSATTQFSVSVRSADSTSNASTESITMWLSEFDEASMQRQSLSPEEAQLYRQVYGAVAYLAVDADNNMTLTKASDITAEELANNTVQSLNS